MDRQKGDGFWARKLRQRLKRRGGGRKKEERRERMFSRGVGVFGSTLYFPFPPLFLPFHSATPTSEGPPSTLLPQLNQLPRPKLLDAPWSTKYEHTAWALLVRGVQSLSGAALKHLLHHCRSPAYQSHLPETGRVSTLSPLFEAGPSPWP